MIVVACLAAGRVEAQRATEHTLRLAEGDERHVATLDDAAWLVGSWRGEGLGGSVDEVWLPPAGNAMVGVFRLTRDDEVDFYEIMTLREQDGSLVLELKHFDADLAAWEAADETVQFPLVKMAPDTLYFDGLTYAREGSDQLRIWLAMGRQDGSAREVMFEFRRRPLPSAHDD